MFASGNSIPTFLTLWNYVVWEKVFPDDLRESNPGSFKFMEMAQAWKAKGSLLSLPVANGKSSETHESGHKVDQEVENQDESSSDGDVDMERRDDAS